MEKKGKSSEHTGSFLRRFRTALGKTARKLFKPDESCPDYLMYDFSGLEDIPRLLSYKPGLRAIISDADNTFGPYDMESPTPRFLITMNTLGKNGLRLFSATNIYGTAATARKEKFASLMSEDGGRLIEDTVVPADVTPEEYRDEPKRFAKPQPDMFLSILEEHNLQPHEVLVVGDQKRSDVKGAHAAGIEAALVVKHGKKDHKWVRFNRPFESLRRLRDGYAFFPEKITRTSEWAQLSFATRALTALRQRSDRPKAHARYVAPLH